MLFYEIFLVYLFVNQMFILFVKMLKNDKKVIFQIVN